MPMRRQSRGIDILLYCVAAVIIGAGAAGVLEAVLHPGIVVSGPSGETERFGDIFKDPFAATDRLHILVLGTDDMQEGRGRTDAIMILFLNPQEKRAALLSLPRDLRVEIPGHGLDKINHAYHFGGVDLTRETVEELLGITIDYYAKVDFQAFEQIVDTLGGVDIDVPFKMRKHTYYGDIRLAPGYQHLDGKQALDFVRYREDSDLKRGERQQQLLRAIIKQKLRLRNLPRLAKVAGIVNKSIDTDMELRKAIALATLLKNLNSSEIMTAVAPMRDRPINGVYYGELRERAFYQMIDDIDDHLNRPAGHIVTVAVLNGFGQPGAAAFAGQLLTDAGFDITDTGNADSFDHEQTVINYVREAQTGAQQAKQALKLVRAEMIEKSTDGDRNTPELVIVLGQDFKDAVTTIQ